MEMTRAFRQCDKDVSAERLNGDVIAVNLKSGAYFTLTGTAADVWTAFTSGATTSACLEALDNAYSMTVPREQVEELLTQCLGHGLITEVVATAAQALSLPNDHERLSWARPVLEIFDDLQDLILLDPIHDTSSLGWPNRTTIDD